MSENKIDSIQVVTYPDGRMNTKNAATYTGLAEKTMAMQRCNGNGAKFVKRGRVFYFKNDLDDWMNGNGRMTSTAQAKHASDQNQHGKVAK
jgi:hypothetical protein